MSAFDFKKTVKSLKFSYKSFSSLFLQFLLFLFAYLKKKAIRFGFYFEKYKNILVKFFLMKRGRYNRPFLHLSAMGVIVIGVIIAPFIAETYPIFSAQSSLSAQIAGPMVSEQSIIVGENVFATNISQKPRDKVITYTVENGDTISSIAQKFGVSSDTIKWENDLTSDNLTVGDTLRILPVTGIAYKVQSGDTVYTIAKKFSTEPQAIADFPFNDFANPETFSLVAGQILIVPEGVKPSERPAVRRQTYIAQGPLPVSGGGFTWPLSGVVSQFASWYHMALDITSPIGTPLVAAHSGTVTAVNVGTWDGGYGTNVYIDKGDGYQSHYAHMSNVNVNVGDSVVGGKTVIGWVGMTGRTTGPHVHFEIRKNGALVNPLSYLQ